MSALQPTGSARYQFNYDLLLPELADLARTTANKIRGRLKSGVIATGYDLKEMKEKLGHGRFGAWLAAEFAMTPRTAERYMATARFDAANSDIMSLLPPGTVEVLSAPSLPESVRTDAVERIRAGEHVTPADIKRVTAGIRSRQRHAKAAETSMRKARRQKPLSEDEQANARVEEQKRAAQDESRIIRADRNLTELVNLVADAIGDDIAPRVVELLKNQIGWGFQNKLLNCLTARLGGGAL